MQLMPRDEHTVEAQSREAYQHRGPGAIFERKAQALSLGTQAFQVGEPLREVTRNLGAGSIRRLRRRHDEGELSVIHLTPRRGECRLEPVLALRRERKAERRSAHRWLERGRHLYLDRAGVRLFLHRIAHAVEATSARRLLPRERPPNDTTPHHAWVVVDDHKSRGEGNVRVLQNTEWSRPLKDQRFDDHARWLEGDCQGFERELGPSCSVEQPEPDAGKRIHEVVGESTPAGLELSRAQMLRRVTDQAGLILLRRLYVVVEALI